jgi:DNA-binding PadR family transcriptional regulator
VSVGALYTTLARLEAKGFLRLRNSKPEPGLRGRARSYCRLTARGTEVVWHSAHMMARMMDGLYVNPVLRNDHRN